MFAKGVDSNRIEKKDILDKVSEFDILYYYFNIDKVPTVTNSPLRKDNRPSFGIYTKDGLKVSYKDFRTREKGGIFDLLGNYWNTNYYETLERVSKDLPKFKGNATNFKVSNNLKLQNLTYKKDIKLQVKVRAWRDYDIEFWESYGISLPWLKFGDVYPISHLFVTKNNTTYIVVPEKYAYAYVEFKDDKVSLKIYQPFSETHKWLNMHDSSVWDLWSKLPLKGENIIITSSRKDALCIWENTGIPACSLQAESNLPKPQVIQELKDRFKHVFVLYDNDFKADINWGRNLGEGLATQFGLKQIEIPEEYQSKDTSDLAKNHNRKIVKSLILQLIKVE